MKARLIGTAIGFVAAYLLLFWILPNVLPQQFGGAIIGASWGFYLIVFFAIFLVISGFLPYNWGKVVREVAYLLLFIAVLIAEMAVVGSFVHKTAPKRRGSRRRITFPLSNRISTWSCFPAATD